MTTSSTRRAAETDTAPPSYGHRSQAVVADGFLFTGGVIGVPLDRSQSNAEYRVPGHLATQVSLCLQHMNAVTVAAGGDSSRVVEVSAFVAQPGARQQVAEILREFLGEQPPILHYQEVADVALHGLIEMDWIASLDETASLPWAAETIAPLGDPSTGERVVLSGPFAITNGVLGHGQNMTAAAENAIEVMATRLATVGAALDDIVKMVVYVDEFDRYPEFNLVTKRLLDLKPLPTRSVIVAPALTGAAAVRIDLIAQR